jgi:hypothetical protein
MEDGTEIHSELLSSVPGEMNWRRRANGRSRLRRLARRRAWRDLAGNLWRFGLDGSDFDRTLLFKTEATSRSRPADRHGRL